MSKKKLKRIRYKTDATDPSIYHSKDQFKINSNVYTVSLDLAAMTVYLARNGINLTQAPCPTVVQLKKKAKELLIEQGIVFESETRAKKVKE